MLRVADCIRDSVRAVIPQTTEWQRIGNQIDARTIWIVDAHSYGKRFIIRADEMLTAFVELQLAIRGNRAVRWLGNPLGEAIRAVFLQFGYQRRIPRDD